jgi:hypothetical protein
LLVGLGSGNILVAECEYLTVQLEYRSAAIIQVAASFSPVVFSVTLYDGMGKINENRDRGTY